MITQALRRLLNDTTLAVNLDYLIIDMPPWYGDVHLTHGAKACGIGRADVTTLRTLPLLDCTQGLACFEKGQRAGWPGGLSKK